MSNAAANPSVDPIVSMSEKALDKLWEVNLKASVQVVQVYKCEDMLTSMMRSSFISMVVYTCVLLFLILILCVIGQLTSEYWGQFFFEKLAEISECM